MTQQKRSSRKNGREKGDQKREREKANNRAKCRDWGTKGNVTVPDTERFSTSAREIVFLRGTVGANRTFRVVM